jgi:hypothetical protein
MYGARAEMLWVWAAAGVVASYLGMRHALAVAPERARKKEERRRAGKSLCPFLSSRW